MQMKAILFKKNFLNQIQWVLIMVCYAQITWFLYVFAVLY